MTERACVTLQHFLLTELSKARRWHKRLLKNNEPENVHQLRISLRKLRSTLKLAKPILNKGYRQRWQQRIRNASKQLDQARDLDVALNNLASPPKSDATLQKQLLKQRKFAYKKLRKQLSCGPFSRWRKLKKQLKHARWVMQHCRQPQRSLTTLAADELERIYQTIYQANETLADLDIAALHRLRIACKQLRYACEFVDTALISQRLSPFLRSLHLLQEQLGKLHDASVQRDLLAALNSAPDKSGTAVISEAVRQNLRRELDRFLNLPKPWRLSPPEQLMGQ